MWKQRTFAGAKAGRGRHPHDLERMLRIYFMRQWFHVPDLGAEDAIYDSESMRQLAGLELAEDKARDDDHAGSATSLRTMI